MCCAIAGACTMRRSAFTPSTMVSRSRCAAEIIRMDRRRVRRIGGLDAHEAAAFRTQQRAHAGDAGKRMQRLADVLHRIKRQRALHVGRRRRRQRAEKASGRQRRDREVAAPEQRVAQHRGRAAMPLPDRVVERQRLLAAQDQPREVMIVEAVADARHVGDHRNAERGEQRRRTEPRQLQKLRRVERAGRHDHFDIGARRARLAADDDTRRPPRARPSNRMRVASASDTTLRLPRRRAGSR